MLSQNNNYDLYGKVNNEIINYLDFLDETKQQSISELLKTISVITLNTYQGILNNCNKDIHKEYLVMKMYNKACDEIRDELIACL